MKKYLPYTKYKLFRPNKTRIFHVENIPDSFISAWYLLAALSRTDLQKAN